MNIQNKLSEILQSHIGGAFLFIGSGFSRRYLNLEDWEGLLTKFCNTGKSFKYYKSSADGNLAKAAELLANDFHEVWWKDNSYISNREKYESFSKDTTSALRIEISHYLKNLNNKINKEYQNEINALENLNIDGIITTNWDMFLENIFPDYEVYIGQQELLFSNPQEVGEIYKIHGSASNPNSLVLTESDYQKFEARNAYLASKLITIFMEHPIIFIGYSLNDENIRAILASIVRCIDDHNLDKLRKNLIFVNRLKIYESESITESSIVFDHISLPITLIKTNNFTLVYNAIRSMKRKIPARILRHFKEQFYEFVYTSEPTEHILVSDIDQTKNYKDIEFVVGVGVKKAFSEQGYFGINALNLMEDVLSDGNNNYDAEKLLTLVFPSQLGNAVYVPIYYYLRKCNINNQKELDTFCLKKGVSLDKFINTEIKINGQYKRKFSQTKDKTIKGLINEHKNVEEVFRLIPFLELQDIILDDLLDFLNRYKNKYLKKEKGAVASEFKKLVTLYDKLKWGW